MIKILALASFAIISMSGLFFLWTRHQYFIRFAALGVFVFAVALIVGNKYVSFLLFAAISTYVVKNEPENAIFFYMVLLPIFPLGVSWFIGVPGIDTLLVLNHNRVLVLCLLAPLLMQMLSSDKPLLDPAKSHSGIVDRLIIFYIVLKALLLFRDFDLLVAARNVILLVIDIWLPYIVISRQIRNFNVVLVLFVYGAVILAVIAIAENRISYRLYDAITLPMGEHFQQMKFRNGLLRATASMGNPLVLGFFFAMPFLVAAKIRSLIQCPWYTPWLLCGVLVLGVESTGSRSPLAASIIGFGVLLWWSFGRKMVRNSALFIFVGFIALLSWLLGGGIESVFALVNDEEGTFSYRYDLILNAQHLIYKNLLFGESLFVVLKDPILLQSLQGEGIIDLTNSYLFLLLTSGIAGCLSFVGMWLAVLRGFYSVDGPPEIASTLMATCIATMFMLAVCSSISFVATYSWILIALSVGFCRNYDKTLT